MKIVNTSEPQARPSVVMMVYGMGGVGKTTFAATAPNPLLLDCENGSKYFGMRGISLDVQLIKDWADLQDRDLLSAIKSDTYDTVIVDPIGEAMEKLIENLKKVGGKKFVQSDGSLTIAGWGEAKNRMRNFVKFLRDTGKNVIFVAHVDEKGDEDRMVKRPMIATKISSEMVNLVDIVAYMTIASRDGEDVRVLMVDPESDKMIAKDRTGMLGKYVEPDFLKIIKACQGTEQYSWTKGAKSNQKAGSKTTTAKKGTKTTKQDEEAPAGKQTPKEKIAEAKKKLKKAKK